MLTFQFLVFQMARGLGMLKDSKSRNLSKIFYDILICTLVREARESEALDLVSMSKSAIY